MKLTEVGEYKGEATIVRVDPAAPNGKCHRVKFDLWETTTLAKVETFPLDKMVVGEKADAVVKVIMLERGTTAFLESFGDLKSGRQGGKGGFGGAKAKTPEEIHSGPISSIIAAAIRAGLAIDDTRPWIKLYRECVGSSVAAKSAQNAQRSPSGSNSAQSHTPAAEAVPKAQSGLTYDGVLESYGINHPYSILALKRWSDSPVMMAQICQQLIKKLDLAPDDLDRLIALNWEHETRKDLAEALSL